MVAWASPELLAALARVSPQQAVGVQRIVEAELTGRTLSALLDCPDQICTSTTYYGYKSQKRTRPGWNDRPEFQQALRLARRDYRSWLLEHGTGDALLVLAQAAPEAARALRQQIVGDGTALESLARVLLGQGDGEERKLAALRLGATGSPRAAVYLAQVLVAPDLAADLRLAVLDALGVIAGWRNREQVTAALGVLDRADVKTAAKQAVTVNDDDIAGSIERELAQLAALRAGADVGAPADVDGGGTAADDVHAVSA